LYDTFQIACNLEQVDDGYFKLSVQPDGKSLSITNEDNVVNIDLQDSNNDQTQHWDVIPTGEKGFYRIKTRTRAAGHIDFIYLQVSANDTVHVNLARRDEPYLGQQWRFV
jgi:hypothetical protein